MAESQFLAIIIGIFGALLGVYFREAIREANNRKKIGIQLEAHIRYWFREILENKSLSEFLVAGQILHQKLIEAYKKGGDKLFLKATEDMKNKIKNVEEFFNKEMITKTINSIKESSESEIQLMLDFISDLKVSIKNNESVIHDKNVAYLPWFVVNKVVEVRSRINSILFTIKYLSIYCRNNNIDEDRVKSLLVSLCEDAIYLSMHLISLREDAEKIRKKRLISNIFDWD